MWSTTTKSWTCWACGTWGGGRPVIKGQGLFIRPLSNGALRAALAFGSTRFGPSQMHVIGQAGHLALSNQKRQSP